MSVNPSPIGGFAAQFFDNNGQPLSGGKIYTYAAGTTTPQATYTSALGVTPHANPIVLDSAGRVPGGEIWLTDSLIYKFVIETSLAVLIGTYDNITGVNSNFVNYTVQEEVITATAGQTVFNLSTINYTPGTNSLSVYIDGVNQYVGDSYLETDSNTVTFTSGLHVGAEVKFTTAVQNTTGAVDASIVSYNPPFTGSVPTNVEDKLAQVVSVMDFGVVADDTDQTTEILAAFSSLGANWEGVILIPGNIRFDFNQVIPAVPSKAIVQFTNTCQIGAGYRQQFTGVISNPPDANTDTAFSVIDPHYPDLMLNNPRTSGTVSGDAGLSGFSWAQGFFQNGSKGPRFQWQANFRRSVVRTAEYGGAGVACFELRTRFPERAINYEDWFNGISVQTNDYILSTNGAFYKALSTGTSTVAPTFTSGSQTVGGVTWQWEDGSFVNFRIPFYVDELGRVGNQAVPSGHTQLWQQNPEDPENFNVFYEASGATKSIRFHFRPTDGGSTRATEAVFDFTESQGFRLLNGNESKIFFAANDVGGLSLGQYGLRTVQPSDGDTTPSVASAGQLRINNTAPTSITDFIDATENQEVSLFFTNSNTTLVHSSALVLKGGINVTPAANQIITIVREPSANAYWVEKSRNF